MEQQGPSYRWIQFTIWKLLLSGDNCASAIANPANG